MIIASQKKKENIAEYLLYMWQVEDLIRANGLDLEKIKANYIDRFAGLTEEQKQAMTDWYESLIDMMRREGVTQKGHLQLTKNTLGELAELHSRLMKDSRFPEYNADFYAVLPYIVEVRSKSGEEKPGEIEALFNVLYGVLMMRLAGKKVSDETAKAVSDISRFLSLLAKYNNLDRENKLFEDSKS